MKALVAVVLTVAVAFPGPGPLGAQERPGAGTVILALAVETPSHPLPSSSRIFLTERVRTGDRLFARLLFAGRVMILAREATLLSITEVPGATTIEVESGRVAVTVDRENLHPEDLVEVRTPHAVVTVPSDTLVVEVAEASTFTPVGRRVEVFPLDPLTGAALEPPTAAAANEMVTVGPPKTPTDVVANR